MANKDITLKRKTSSGTDNLHPTTTWTQVNDKPTTFTPTAHTHTKSDITDFAHTHTLSDITDSNTLAPKASPALTGTPTAPTAANSTNTTQIATTAFVTNKLAGIGGGGLNFEGTIDLSGIGGKNGDDLASAGLTAAGDYLIVSGTGVINNDGSPLVTLSVQAPGDEGDSTLPVTLETGDWIVYVSGSGSTMTVSIINNTDTRFAASTHTHTIANVTGLQTALDGKLGSTAKAADSNLLDGIDSSAFLRSNATDTATGSITFSGDMFAKNVDFVGGTSYNENIRMHPGTNDYSSLILGAVSGTSGTGAGQWSIVRYPTATYNNKFAIRHNSTDAMTIDTSGVLYSGASSKIFHDGYHPNADKLTTARNIALTGAVTGSANFDGSGNISISTTATADPTLTLSGDASGSATFTNLGNATLSVTVANDSHTHDGRYYTESESNGRYLTRLSTTSALNVNAANGTQLFTGSTGAWTNRGPSGNNAGALLSLNTHSGNYYSQLWFDTANRGFITGELMVEQVSQKRGKEYLQTTTTLMQTNGQQQEPSH
jgi:hypothetical protein